MLERSTHWNAFESLITVKIDDPNDKKPEDWDEREKIPGEMRVHFRGIGDRFYRY